MYVTVILKCYRAAIKKALLRNVKWDSKVAKTHERNF